MNTNESKTPRTDLFCETIPSNALEISQGARMLTTLARQLEVELNDARTEAAKTCREMFNRLDLVKSQCDQLRAENEALRKSLIEATEIGSKLIAEQIAKAYKQGSGRFSYEKQYDVNWTINQMLDEVEQLRKDKEMLDWVVKNFYRIEGILAAMFWSGRLEKNLLLGRRAIIAAMKENK